jgi:7-cyano-7-deazaguanine synthase in queuosine biosynthesis
MGEAPLVGAPYDLLLDWQSERANSRRDLNRLLALLPAAPSPLAVDLAEIASAVYLSDLALQRGRNEEWVRHWELEIPVREADFWRSQSQALSHLLYVLTRDEVAFEFVPLAGPVAELPARGSEGWQADCVSLLSGGIDSLAGAVLQLQTHRQPLFVAHQSGNPTIRRAQQAVSEMLTALAPGQWRLGTVLLHGGGGGREAWPFPPPAEREPSQRSRSLLFMSLAVLAASGQGVDDIFVAENGILTVALPLSGARIGGHSTRSTHPRVLNLVNDLIHSAGLSCRLSNPFVYQTKAELISHILRPSLSPFDIQRTVSCWAAGRQSRQCGACVACLIRRFAMLAAGLPDEAYQADLLGHPSDYVGTEGYGNLMDLLGLCNDFMHSSDLELLQRLPELLEMQSSTGGLADTLAMYRRFATEVQQVVRDHFPVLQPLLEG